MSESTLESTPAHLLLLVTTETDARGAFEDAGYRVHTLMPALPAEALLARAELLGAAALVFLSSTDAIRARVREVVEALAQRGAKLAVLAGGDGVDEPFALDAALTTAGLYRGGVYYFEDLPEALQVLKYIVTFVPEPATHDHGAADACDLSSCNTCAAGCPLNN